MRDLKDSHAASACTGAVGDGHFNLVLDFTMGLPLCVCEGWAPKVLYSRA